MMHNTDTIYRKLRMNASVLPPEILLLIKDLDQRLEALEEGTNNEEARTEKPSSSRPKSSNISEGKVSPDNLQIGSE
tara:strand:- start:163 stop:393 length:231 start_codon:yes stop_codon:yes gene_type:complete